MDLGAEGRRTFCPTAPGDGEAEDMVVVKSPRGLRAKIETLPAHQPRTVAFERALLRQTTRARPIWYANQKEHWIGWLNGYSGPGA